MRWAVSSSVICCVVTGPKQQGQMTMAWKLRNCEPKQTSPPWKLFISDICYSNRKLTHHPSSLLCCTHLLTHFANVPENLVARKSTNIFNPKIKANTYMEFTCYQINSFNLHNRPVTISQPNWWSPERLLTLSKVNSQWERHKPTMPDSSIPCITTLQTASQVGHRGTSTTGTGSRGLSSGSQHPPSLWESSTWDWSSLS
jgi:hypothetical protein